MLRHGVTTAPRGTYLGARSDLPLSARGAEQARVAGVRLACRSFSAVRVSPLLRARATLALALPATDPIVDGRLRELDMGVFSGLTWEQIKARGGEAARAWRAGSAAPGGEAAWQMWRRAIELGVELAERLPRGADALLVTHSGPIRALRGSAHGLSPVEVRRLRVPHGGLRCILLTPAVLERWRTLLAQEPPLP
ncbi:MAG: histidine phosphatase family protein [Candidatus Limnocylindrales bacterium]